MKKKDLKRENEQLRKEMGILITDPESPEAHMIRVQWAFAKEVKKQMDTGQPVDVPKLMGLVGKMLYPYQKNFDQDDKG